MQSHKLPPLLQQVLSKLDVAYGDPGRVVDLGDIAALMEAIGFTIDPREHPGWVTVMNKDHGGAWQTSDRQGDNSSAPRSGSSVHGPR